MAGLKADGIGAKPLLFLPNAFIREFIAIVVMYKRRHIIVYTSCHRYGYVILNRIDYSVKKEFPYEFVSKFIQNERLRRFCVLALIIFVLYLSRSMITTILLTFIFTYLAVRLVHFVQRYMKIPTIVIVLLTYALVVFSSI